MNLQFEVHLIFFNILPLRASFKVGPSDSFFIFFIDFLPLTMKWKQTQIIKILWFHYLVFTTCPRYIGYRWSSGYTLRNTPLKVVRTEAKDWMNLPARRFCESVGLYYLKGSHHILYQIVRDFCILSYTRGKHFLSTASLNIHMCSFYPLEDSYSLLKC